MILYYLLSLPGLAFSQGAPQDPEPQTRSFTHRVVVEAAAEDLYRLWTTAEGVRTVFPGADARIGSAVGGDYCVMFSPHDDPGGDKLGTNGCKILALDENRAVTFEWKAPPWAPQLNVQPFPTAVTVELESIGPKETAVVLRHTGFDRDASWDRPFEYFQKAWKGVLTGLQRRFAAKPEMHPAIQTVQAKTLYVVRLSRGPRWIEDEPVTAQPRLMNHVAYMHSLMEKGVCFMGGRLGEEEGLGILTVPDEATARRLMAADPAVQAGTFRFTIQPWKTVMPDDLREALQR